MNRLILHRLSSPLVDVVRDAAELIDGYHRAVRSGFDGVEIVVDQFGQGTAAPTVMKSAETLAWPWDGSSRNARAYLTCTG